jgi:DNA-binding XRE family transcriptional regulator
MEDDRPQLSPEVMARACQRAAAVRAEFDALRDRLGREPQLEDICTPQEIADGAPWYFVLRGFVHQCKANRVAAGLTLEDVSDRSGIAVESLARLEAGADTNPTWRTLGMYARAVGCKPVLTATQHTPAPARREGGRG